MEMPLVTLTYHFHQESDEECVIAFSWTYQLHSVLATMVSLVQKLAGLGVEVTML